MQQSRRRQIHRRWWCKHPSRSKTHFPIHERWWWDHLHRSSTHIPRKARQNAFEKRSYKSESNGLEESLGDGGWERWWKEIRIDGIGFGKLKHILGMIGRKVAERTKPKSHRPRPWLGPAAEEMKSERKLSTQTERLSRGGEKDSHKGRELSRFSSF